MDNFLKSQTFQLKGRLYTLTVLQLMHLNLPLFEDELKAYLLKAPKLFSHAPIVIDCGEINISLDELNSLKAICQKQGLMIVGVQGSYANLDAIAEICGLAVLGASAKRDKPLTLPEPEPTSEPIYETSYDSKLITLPIRSGQQVYSKHGDLIIVSPVSHGAELLAKGHIHVYGPLRGRVLAGITGDKNARIFCQSLDAELISIAGVYKLSEDIEPPQGPCQIYLEDEHLRIEAYPSRDR